MKRALIGCWLTLLGTIWGACTLIAASRMQVDSWDPAIGRLLTTVWKKGLTVPLIISVLFLLLGLVIMAIEYFRE